MLSPCNLRQHPGSKLTKCQMSADNRHICTPTDLCGRVRLTKREFPERENHFGSRLILLYGRALVDSAHLYTLGPLFSSFIL
jgi:hypothetical protein